MSHFLTPLFKVARVPLAILGAWAFVILLFLGAEDAIAGVAIPIANFGVATAAAYSGWVTASAEARRALVAVAAVATAALIPGVLSAMRVIFLETGVEAVLILTGVVLGFAFLIGVTYFARPGDADGETAGPAPARPAIPRPSPLDEVAAFRAAVAPFVAERTAALALQMVAEAARLRRLSVYALSGVAALISLAVLIVLFAGYITSIDLTGADPLVKANDYARETSRALNEALTDRARTKASVEDGAARIEAALARGAEPARRLDFDLEQARSELASARERLEVVESQIPDLQQNANTAQEVLRRVRARDIEAENAGSGAQTTEALIASAVTRFGVIVVLMFLAQALINLYRYALRLAAFHRSRAYMLALTDGDMSQLESAVRMLSADHVSLGREPRAPLDEAKRLAEIARDLKP